MFDFCNCFWFPLNRLHLLFQASCSACNATFHSATNYAQHQAVHFKDKNFSFPCPTCDHQFRNISSFLTHHSRFHSVAATNDQAEALAPAVDVLADVLLDADYRCSEITCQVACRTKKELRQHTENHIQNGFVILCPFQPCRNKFSKLQNFRTHCSRYHRNIEMVEPEITYNLDGGAIGFSDDVDEDGFDIAADDEEEDEEDEDDDNEEDDYDSGLDCEANGNRTKHDNVYPENMVRDHVGKFYLWLEGVLLIPTTKVQAISEEVASLLEMSHHRIKVSLKQELITEGMDENRSEKIIESVMKRDVVYNTHHKGMDAVNLTTDHMRKQFIKNRCAFIEPVQVPLGSNKSGKKKFAHYIPLRDTLNVMFNDTTVQDHIDASFNKVNTPGIYEDFTDGSAFTDHPICGLMKSIQIILFQDAFEFYPLSPTSGTYKCVGFYFMLGNIQPCSRSKVDAIQLVYLVKETDLKQFGPEKVLQKLIEELQELCGNGIKYKGETLPVVVTHMCGDNLGQHFIGGYLENFTGNYYCRFCEATKKMVEENPSCTLPFRTPEQYDEVIGQLDPENPDDYKKGIRKESVLNKIPNFHVCNPGQPPCIGHDVLEGVAKNDFGLFLRYFINVKSWITLETLNRRIEKFKYKGRDSADSLLKLDKSLKKIKGHASEVWLFVRLFPFLIGDEIQENDDPVWQLALMLKKICEYLFAPKSSDEMVAKVKQLIFLYNETRAKIFQKKLQPKHHFMGHFADLIGVFGPLIRLWTLRFESRHVFFKQAAKTANNFKNITKTLANKYVLNFAYKFTGNMFPQSISFRDVDATSISLVGDMKPEVEQILKEDLSYRTILKSVEVRGMTYNPGLWILYGRQGRNLLVGEILLIVYNGENIKLIFKMHPAEDSFQGFYRILADEGYSFVLQKDLKDYYPLPAYEHQGSLCLSLKHASPLIEMP